MSDPIDVLVGHLSVEMDSKSRQWVTTANFCQSPIERYLVTAVKALLWWSYPESRVAVLEKEPSGVPRVVPLRDVAFWPQAPVGRYRADFKFYRFLSDDKGWEHLIVECDGHDFHEKTKEQAAHDKERDRYMQDLDMRVYRYTGSEIYRDPIKCAVEILAWCEGISLAKMVDEIRRGGGA